MCTVEAAVAISLVSAVGQTYVQYQDQRAANRAAKYNAEIQQRNAGIAESQAKSAVNVGRRKELQQRLRTLGLKGQQRSTLAASGVVVSEGSASDLLFDTSALGEIDATTIRHNAELDAWKFRTQAGDYRAQSNLSLLSQRSPGAGATASLLQGASNATNTYLTYKNS